VDEYGEVEIYHTDIVLTVRSLLLFGGGSDAGGGMGDIKCAIPGHCG
jgi:hypothetical protein